MSRVNERVLIVSLTPAPSFYAVMADAETDDPVEFWPLVGRALVERDRRDHSDDEPNIDYLSPMDYERYHAAVLGHDRQQISAPPPRAAGKIEDNVIEAHRIGEAPNQSPSPTPSTETG